MAATTLSLHELRVTPQQALARVQQCRDLDEVLAIGTPAQLVRLLFGESGTKVIVEPFGDALVRGLARPTKSLSSIAFAMACTNVVDPQRLATILELDDDGHDLLGNADLRTFSDDIELVIGSYRDAKRRLTLLQGLWAETLAWAKGQSQAQEFVRYAKSAAQQKLPPTVSASVSGLPNSEAAYMILEWLVQRFLEAEERCVAKASQGHAHLTLTETNQETRRSVASVIKRQRAAVDLLVAYDRLTAALPAEKPNRGEVGTVTREYLGRLWAPSWKRLRTRILRLCRVAGFPGVIEGIDAATATTWMENGNVYFGLATHLEVQLGPEAIQRRSPPATTLPKNVGLAASFLRLQATLPTKPKSWHTFLLDLLEPYYVHLTIQIQHPGWVQKLDGVTLAPTDLVVRVPKDMRELSLWGAYMHNCVHSIFGEDVHEGKRVILGLFRGDTLTYNVGAFAGEGSEGTVWEVNSRFNNDEVEPGVEALIQKLVFTATNADRILRPKPLKTPTPKMPGGSKRAPRTWTHKRVRDLGARLRAQAPDQWVASLNRLANGSTDATWVETVVRIQRLPTNDTITKFEQLVTSGVDIWPLLIDNPLDHVILDSEWTDTERQTLTDLRNGSELIRRRSTAALLDDPAVSAAWEFSQTSAHLRLCFAQLLTYRPREVAGALQSDLTETARWVAGVLWVLRADELEAVPTLDRTRTVPFDIPTTISTTVWQQVTLFNNALAAVNPTGDWTASRVTAGLPIPRCPQLWLRRKR
jgi:hypothetical protein